jgi:hypothetical protein
MLLVLNLHSMKGSDILRNVPFISVSNNHITLYEWQASTAIRYNARREKALDNSYKRIQGLDGLTPTHPSASVTDTRKAKLGGDQGQLYLAFLRTNEKVTISEDILVPVDGYAGAGARFLERETMSQLQQAQRRVNQLRRQVSQQQAHIQDLTNELEEKRSKLLVQEDAIQRECQENALLKGHVEALKWESYYHPFTHPLNNDHNNHNQAFVARISSTASRPLVPEGQEDEEKDAMAEEKRGHKVQREGVGGRKGPTLPAATATAIATLDVDYKPPVSGVVPWGAGGETGDVEEGGVRVRGSRRKHVAEVHAAAEAEMNKLADDSLRRLWMGTSAIPCLADKRMRGESLLVTCGVCQSPVHIYSTANHVTRDEFCAVVKERDLLKVQLDEAWQLGQQRQNLLPIIAGLREEKRALEALYSRQMRELNMSHDEVAALRVVRERELKPLEEQIAHHQDANKRLQEKIETLQQHLNLSRLDDILSSLRDANKLLEEKNKALTLSNARLLDEVKGAALQQQLYTQAAGELGVLKKNLRLHGSVDVRHWGVSPAGDLSWRADASLPQLQAAVEDFERQGLALKSVIRLRQLGGDALDVRLESKLAPKMPVFASAPLPILAPSRHGHVTDNASQAHDTQVSELEGRARGDLEDGLRGGGGGGGGGGENIPASHTLALLDPDTLQITSLPARLGGARGGGGAGAGVGEGQEGQGASGAETSQESEDGGWRGIVAKAAAPGSWLWQ